VRFGWSTDTYDRAPASPTSEKREVVLDPDELERALDRFRGEFAQTPPQVSAKKVDGRRALRDGPQKTNPYFLEPVPVHVYELLVLGIDGPEVRLRAHCSGGTYLRSIAHDVGQALGCGAHLRELRRTSSGEFEIEQARTLAQLESLAAEERLLDALVPPANMLPGFPGVYVDELTVSHIRNGRNFNASPFRSQPASRFVKAIARQGELVAIAKPYSPTSTTPSCPLSGIKPPSCGAGASACQVFRSPPESRCYF